MLLLQKYKKLFIIYRFQRLLYEYYEQLFTIIFHLCDYECMYLLKDVLSQRSTFTLQGLVGKRKLA